MSSPSTPRSTRAASPTANSPMMLTPGQKIKAMMAAFDSDSESDSGKKASTQEKESPKPTHNENQSVPKRPQFGMHLDSDSSADEEEDIVMPKGRMAARMQAQSQTGNAGGSRETAFERVSKALREDKGETDDNPRDTAADEVMSSDGDGDDDDDDLPKAGPRRRAANTTPEPDAMSDRSSRRARRDDSPLFVSSAPNSPQNGAPDADTDNDEDSRPRGNSRFLALVAQKRKEREEKERLEAEKKAAIARRHEEFSSEIGLDEEDSADDGGAARKLTQQSRPARKASKKALEDMNRETQRMSRNMQLAHQAQTKKKITKESFFARFNFMQPKDSGAPGPSHDSSSADGSQHSSDVEAQKNKETPQTSPVLGPADKPSTEQVTDGPAKEVQSENTVLPPPQPENPIVGQAELQSADPPLEKSKNTPKKAPVQVNLSRQQVAANQDSDDELEIITSPAKCRRYAAFENLPLRRAQEPSSMTTFRALAHLTSPTRRSTPSMADFSAQMLYKARQQALKERSQRIQELRDKGIHVETAAERAAMEDEIENLVEKARLEGEEIAKKEKAAKRRDAPDDDDDDDDYQLSGSDDELAQGDDEDEDEGEEDEDGSGKKEGGLIDSEAGEDDDSDDNQSEVMSDQEVEVPTQRRKRPTRVISDDEDEEQVPATPVKPIVSAVTSVERPQIPGLPSDDKTMSLTQAFAGTLGGSQQGSQQDPSTIPTIPLSLPDPAQMLDNQGPDSPAIIKDSQEQRAQSVDLLAGYSESVTRVSESPAPRGMSYFSQVPDPTQDEGFVLSPFDPSKRFLGTPTSTIETVRIDRSESRNASPIAQRKKKALRRGKVADLSMVVEQDEEAEEADEEHEDEDQGDFEVDASAFNIMKKAAKKPSDFDKKKSKAREVVEEAAEESDDEYAGLGGASDDDDDEENMFDRQMINDNSGETVDEKQLAALNALHQRNADEKQVAKLLKDITTGALRRRKNNDDDLDLDDSDDELMARRREKQREFARMRKALLADSKVGEIAENPKKAAFFKAVEDRDDDDDDLELDFLNFEENSQSQESSSQTAAAAPGQQDTAEESNKRKRPLEPSAEDINNRPPPHLRRKPASALSKKPATLAEVRETVSFLTERPEYDSFHEDASMDDVEEPIGDEGNNTTSEGQSPNQTEEQPAGPSHHPRRTKGPVVDRLALLRQASSNSATSSSNNRFAFHTGPGGNQAPSFGFRPPMLRKTTTGSSSSSTSTTSDSSKRVSKPPVGGKKGGAVNYYTAAREKEREKALRSKNRGGSNITALLSKHSNNRLGALGGGGQWE
ncbi:uncharacterized protein BDW47DRAFT_100268 [Aspergillus candidus]|uniref:MRC1-like domain-domain-containing protein n=1 Tax=Aspergillus candidus TaxID=41067 RepID=A0A2I2FK18_ASPCN|nr:MRC1-like domain-domain-containing protein [Aspergillus candidus]PLB40969.1 MRC1-like domain-domain-containing protein [Aspergillus candidus]